MPGVRDSQVQQGDGRLFIFFSNLVDFEEVIIYDCMKTMLFVCK